MAADKARNDSYCGGSHVQRPESDVNIKCKNEYIQKIRPTGEKIIVKNYDVSFNSEVPNTKVTSLENYSINNALIDSTKRRISSIESDNSRFVIQLKKTSEEFASSHKSLCVKYRKICANKDYLNKSKIDDKFLKDNNFVAANPNLDNALLDCMDTFTKVTSLENYSTNNASIDSTKRCISSIESDNSRFVIQLKNTPEEFASSHKSLGIKYKKRCANKDYLNKSKIDKFLKDNNSVAENSNLDNALLDCMDIIHCNLSDNKFDKIVNKNENVTTSIFNFNSNLHQYKKNASLLSVSRIKNDNSYFNTTVEIKNLNNRPRPKSRQEIAVGIPNIFADQSSEVEHYKKTFERFLQQGICLSLPPTINKCIECRVYQKKSNLTKRDYDSITCRFYSFRQLKFKKNGNLAVAGFPDPNKKVQAIDIGMWLPGQHISTPSHFDIQASRKILEDAGGQFCKFVEDERKALKLNWSSQQQKRKIVWKKYVNGIREMCDVCKTTIFNHHWSCGNCGFVVCVDCYKSKLEGNQQQFNNKMWLPCSGQKDHEVDQLSITQILAGDALDWISKLMHKVCISHKILLDCKCSGTSRLKMLPISTNIISDLFQSEDFGKNSNEDDDKINKDSKFSTSLKEKCNKYCESIKPFDYECDEKNKGILLQKNYIEKKSCSIKYLKRNGLFAPQMSLLLDSMSSSSYMWLCEGKLLFLLDPSNSKNYKLFQKQWKCGQPVMVKNVGKNLNPSLWHPEAFSRDFGSHRNDLINCTSGNIISDQPMSKFWDGFENASNRLCNSHGNTMLLKLKDWPPSADFADTLPDRFQDLMKCLPLKEYTHRTGRLNLASHLPKCFVPPDLGPKMYTAYGNAGTKHRNIGTTNLHLDISDAVNVMVYVAITKNCKDFSFNWHVTKALQIIEEAGCDDLTKKRIYINGEIPGALWHIYDASDADFIRDLLIKVSIEHGMILEKHSDPIHDQSHYLDDYLRERLFNEYGVKGYTIVQCYGDAIFIPAGAPHQVRNLHNCIKVAEDFVSPENVHHSFRMTQEFRNLTDSHSNHEDKLQIKNIVFHSVKESISVLLHNL